MQKVDKRKVQTRDARILRAATVIDRTGLARSAIDRGVKDGTFPAPIKLGPQAVGWSARDVDRWIDDKLGETVSNA